jgi:predicted hotdog family 3-hydroxylacyl-ACP dehydratase
VSEFPPVRELIPHEGPMVLLDRVLAHDEDATTCSIAIADQLAFREDDGSVPVWFGIEYMAQCIAVHAALVLRAEGQVEPPRGFLVGARGVRFHVERFDPSQRLEATATRRWAGSRSLISFECALRDATGGKVLAEGRLNCFMVPAGAGLDEA